MWQTMVKIKNGSAIIVGCVVAIASSLHSAESQAIEYEFILHASPVTVAGRKFSSVVARLVNRSKNVVAYTAKHSELECPPSVPVDSTKRADVRFPSSWKAASSGVLTPGTGSRSTLTTVGVLRDEKLGLVGPIEGLEQCAYSISYLFWQLDQTDFSLLDIEPVEIRRTVVLGGGTVGDTHSDLP